MPASFGAPSAASWLVRGACEVRSGEITAWRGHRVAGSLVQVGQGYDESLCGSRTLVKSTSPALLLLKSLVGVRHSARCDRSNERQPFFIALYKMAE